MRNKLLLVMAIAVPSLIAVLSPNAVGQELKTVPFVDLARYQGRWYEIARYPNRFEKKCVGNTTATYKLKPDGTVDVVNQCVTKDKKLYTAKGEAKVVNRSTNSKLKVRFAPSFLSFLPLVWGNYWIIYLDSDYRSVAIGDPKREYFWILARSPQMDRTTYKAILDRAKELGFDPTRVVRTLQSIESKE
jgi:apolipoprotein D and lipocalin family protein